MLKKILSSIIIVAILCAQSFAALADYRNEKDISLYKSYIESRGEKILADKTVLEKLDLLVKVNSLLEKYEDRTSFSDSDKKIINFLYAFEEYVKEDIAQLTQEPEEKQAEIIRNFPVIELETLDDLLKDSYILGNSEAEITWIEYSDLECPFCARLHNDTVLDDVMQEYGDQVNFTLQHFPLSFHVNALEAAQAMECVWEQNADVYYDVLDESFETYWQNNFSLNGFYDIAQDHAIDRQKLVDCVEDETYKQKVETQMENGQRLFQITGTPGNILINNETGEYIKIPGAYPFEAFQQSIDTLLK